MKLAIETRLMRKIINSKQSHLFVTKAQQIIIENVLGNIPPKSEKVKTVKHVSENQKQKVQHQEKQQEKPLDKPSRKPTHHKNKSNTDKNKEPRKKVMILNGRMVTVLNEFGLSKNHNVKGAYIKYVVGGPDGFTNFSKKFRSPGGDHTPKYFMALQFFQKIFYGSFHQF